MCIYLPLDWIERKKRRRMSDNPHLSTPTFSGRCMLSFEWTQLVDEELHCRRHSSVYLIETHQNDQQFSVSNSFSHSLLFFFRPLPNVFVCLSVSRLRIDILDSCVQLNIPITGMKLSSIRPNEMLGWAARLRRAQVKCNDTSILIMFPFGVQWWCKLKHLWWCISFRLWLFCWEELVSLLGFETWLSFTREAESN